jgi:hypothetical protein
MKRNWKQGLIWIVAGLCCSATVAEVDAGQERGAIEEEGRDRDGERGGEQAEARRPAITVRCASRR